MRYAGRIEVSPAAILAGSMEQPAQQPQANGAGGSPPATTGTTAAQTAAMQAANAQAANTQISQYLRTVCQQVIQNIASGTVTNPTSTGNNQVQATVRAVGLVKYFILELTASLENTGADEASLTTWNAANLLSNISFFDLDNYQRINCAGWFMQMINSAKEGFPFPTAILSTAFDTPIKYGSNFSVISASSTLAATDGTGTVVMRYLVPLAYSNTDLRGSIYVGVVNSTAYLQFTINPAPGSASGDPTLAVYSGTDTAVVITSLAWTVYQVYLDQLPRYPQGANAGAPILPPIDISTQYRLVTTNLTGVVVGQDFPVPFSNFQSFLSLGVIYDQNGTLNPGSDLNYFALAAANTYQLFKYSPFTQAMFTRMQMMTDWPDGSYNFNFRNQPINTNQTGNMQLLLNAITAASGTTVYAGFESFALINTVLGAASLPAS